MWPTMVLWPIAALGLCLSVLMVARRQTIPAPWAFQGMMLAASAWALAHGVQLATPNAALQTLGFNLTYLGKMSVPPLWVSLALAYTGATTSLPPQRQRLLWVIPGLTVLAALTNPWHGWLWQANGQPGMLVWPTMLYNYGLLGLGLFELLRASLHLPTGYRQQSLGLFVMGLAPMLAHGAYVTGLSGALDTTPLFIGLVGCLYVWWATRWRLFDWKPITRDTLIENMRDAVLVLDPQQRIRDANPAAGRLLQLTGQAVGQPVQHALAAYPKLLEYLQDPATTRAEVILSPALCVELTCTPVALASGTLTAQLAVLRDITARHRAEASLRTSEDKAMRLLEQLAILRWIALNTSSGLDLNHVYETLHEECRGLMPISSFYIALFHAETEMMTFPFFMDKDQARDVPPRHLHTHPGLTGKVILNRRTLYLPDTLNPPADLGVTIVRSSDDFARSFLGVPLMLKERVVGVLSAQSYQPNAYTPDHIEFMEMLAVQAAIAVEHSWLYTQAQHEIESRKQVETSLRAANEQLYAQLREIERLQAELRDQASRDPLTGLFNRRHLQKALPEALAHAQTLGQPVSVVILDMDHFKKINDTYGHSGGDQMLCALAELLRTQAGPNATVCRYGGEEFVAVLPNTPPPQAHTAACAWLAAFAALQVTTPDGHPMQATFSAGVAGFPTHTASAERLLQTADDALYAAKHAGRNQVHLATN